METRVCASSIPSAEAPTRGVATPSPVPPTTTTTSSTTSGGIAAVAAAALTSGSMSQSPAVVLPSTPSGPTQHQTSVPKILSRNANGTREFKFYYYFK